MRRVQLCDPGQEVDTTPAPAPPAPPTVLESFHQLPRRMQFTGDTSISPAQRVDALDQLINNNLISRTTFLSEMMGLDLDDEIRSRSPPPPPSDTSRY